MKHESGLFAKTRKRELLGIETRRWWTPPPVDRAWGGYPSIRKKCAYLAGMIAFIAVWVCLLVGLLRG